MHNSHVFKHEQIKKSRKETYQKNRFGIVFNRWSDQHEVHLVFPDGLTKLTIKKLVNTILPWCYTRFICNAGISQVLEISNTELEQIFGDSQLGEKLAKILLFVEDTTWSYGEVPKCKFYMLNKRNFKTMMDITGIREEMLIFNEAEKLKLNFIDELKSGKLNYKKKAYRRYHDLINARSRIRDYIVSSEGYKYECDVSSCAPVVIVGLAKKCGIKWDYRFLNHYLKNPKIVRQKIAEKCGAGIDAKLVKGVINAAIHGAEFNRHGRIFELCAGSGIKLWMLHRNKKLMKLIGELRHLIEKLDELGQVVVPSDFDKELTDGRKVFLLYSGQEEQLQLAWEKFINEIGGRVIHVHDGFYTDVEFDVNELEDYLQQVVGIEVKIDVEEISVEPRLVLHLTSIDEI